MKKIFAVVTALLCFLGCAAFAEEADDLLKKPQDSLTRVIIPEDQHVTNKTASVKLEYTAIADEVHAYYTVLAVSYDSGEAMNTILECLNDFKHQYGYLSYKYLRKDSVKYFKDEKGMKWARHEQYVKFDGKTAF